MVYLILIMAIYECTRAAYKKYELPVSLDIKFDDLVFILRQSFLLYGTKFRLHGISIDPKAS